MAVLSKTKIKLGACIVHGLPFSHWLPEATALWDIRWPLSIGFGLNVTTAYF